MKSVNILFKHLNFEEIFKEVKELKVYVSVEYGKQDFYSFKKKDKKKLTKFKDKYENWEVHYTSKSTIEDCFVVELREVKNYKLFFKEDFLKKIEKDFGEE